MKSSFLVFLLNYLLYIYDLIKLTQFMKKTTLLTLITLLLTTIGFSQSNRFWISHNPNDRIINKDKAVARLAFPKDFKLFDLNITPLRQQLFSIVGNQSVSRSTIISLPNADGGVEEFEVYEASNFEPDLQAQFPEIRAYSGKGITDRYATLKLSISPQGIQTMVFRADKESEFIEAYSQDHTTYAVFKSQRQKGALAWTCSTEDQKLVQEIGNRVSTNTTALSSAGQLKTMRLAQSCNAEYSNYFGATNASQVGLVVAAFNATLTRCNGVYEKDLALHLNLVAGSTNVIYYNPTTDPYTTMGNWNTQLQQALNTTLTGTGTSLAVNNAAYDVGHMFGASGGGGNAGCIGCVCVNGVAAGTGGTKGRGITSPADGIPQGDNFDIDYVVHEIGHQLGGNHTFSNSNEGAGVNKEVGSGVTIMGYAGITGQDVAPHSIDIYHETTIEQIQNNLATKLCPITTSLLGTNATPVVAPVANYIIPRSTPFVLTGSATDADVADALTYCWEQNDDGASSTGANSSASITKTIGPNFISWLPTASPSRYFPKLSSIIANSATTSQVGGDAGMLSEALSSVSRTLNFRLTVRDNSPYSSTAPIKVGQTAYTDMVVTVNAAAGPFVVNTPNTAVSWIVGTNQTVLWNVAGTTGNGVNSPFVDVFLSTDGGLTYPIQLANKVPNNGSTVVTVPNNVGTNNRIMVKGYQHIFFDISNTNFTITTAPSTFAVTQSSVQSTLVCSVPSTTYTFDYIALGGFTGTTTFSASGNPAGTNVTFSPASLSSSNGTVVMTIDNLLTAPAGVYNINVNATSGADVKTVPFYLYLGLPDVTLTSPANNAVAQNTSLALTWSVNPSASSYNVQVATDAGFNTIISSGSVTTNVYNVNGLTEGVAYFWRVAPVSPSCTGNFSTGYKFVTGIITCLTATSTNVPITIPTTANVTANSTLNVTSTNTVSDANVTIDITHSWVNDMTITLISPSGTQVQLVAQPCTSVALNDITATFDDAGVPIVCGNNPAISGVVIPAQALSAFNGEPMNGTWTLRVLDSFNQDGGSINGWSLNLCNTAPALAVNQNIFENFALYPNPNNGTFTVQFNSLSDNSILIGIHDIRGREVFSKTYQNNGFFNEKLQLDNLQSGVYLINIQDGDKKITKKIVIE
ncbi:zinc-dependent metalloprotease family protein [Flavobacterium chungnamense]|uniref:Zinc-dependent metalloprotease family protein n=2 Tax=Flavobacterium chungnamense TaxID=706182 RepID=A0ABP7ULE8_9FLAO